MIFEKDKYYKYIGTLEKIVNAIYIIYIFIGAVFGAAIGKVKGMSIGILITLLLATLHTITIKIKIQEMKWKMDIHEILNKNKNNT